MTTHYNDITKDSLVSGKGDGDKFAKGWDLIFGKKDKEPFPVGTTFKVSEILEDPTHEAHKDLVEMLAKLESGELCLS